MDPQLKQIEKENQSNKHWLWIVLGIILFLGFLNFLLLRSLCTDNWFIKLLGLPSECRTSQVSDTNTGLGLKTQQKLSLSGNTIILSDGGGEVQLDFTTATGPEGLAGANGSSGSNGIAGATGATGAPGTPGSFSATTCGVGQASQWDGSAFLCIPAGGGGTLDQAYNFGGPAAGRLINATNANEPVEIRTPLGAGPFAYNLGLKVVGDGGAGNPLTSGFGFAKLSFGGFDASGTVFSSDVNNFASTTFGYQLFQNVPGFEALSIGLSNQASLNYGTIGLGTNGINVSAGQSDMTNGNGLELYLSSGDSGTVSGSGGRISIYAGGGLDNGGQINIGAGPSYGTGTGGDVYINSGYANNGNAGQINLNGGSSNNGVGGAISVNTGYGDVSGGNLTLSTGGSGLSGLGGNIYLNASSAASAAGGLSVSTGASNNSGGDVSFNLGGGNVGTGGTYTINTGTSSNAAGGAFTVNTANGFTSGGDIKFNLGSETSGAGSGGSFNVYAGTGLVAGGINMIAGTGIGTGNGGNMNFVGGQGGNTADGGQISFTAGSGGFTSGNGGIMDLSSGNPSAGSNGNGGLFNLDTGSGDGTGNGGNFQILTGTGGPGGAGGNIALSTGSGGTGNGIITFGTGYIERARFDQAGNFGINTTNPANLLSVNGNANTTGHSAFGSYTTTVNDGSLIWPGATFDTVLSNQEILTNPNVNYAEGITNYISLNPSASMLRLLGDKPGIKLGSPAYQAYASDNELEINAANIEDFGLVNGVYGSAKHSGTGNVTYLSGIIGVAYNASSGSVDNALGLSVQAGNTGTGNVTNSIGIDIENNFNSGGGTVDNNFGLLIKDQSGVGSIYNFNLYSQGAATTNYFEGRVGINTLAPASKLEVDDSLSGAADFVARFNNSGNSEKSNGILITGGADAPVTPISNLIEFRRPDGTTIGAVQQNTATSVSYLTTSDERLKHNITDTQFNLDTVLNIKVHDYVYNGDPNETVQTGYIAQELQKLFPTAVSVIDTKTGTLGVDYSKLTPLLTKGLQDLNDKLAQSVKDQNGKLDETNKQLADQGLRLDNISEELKTLSQTVQKNTTDIQQNTADIEKLKEQNQSLQQRLDKLENK